MPSRWKLLSEMGFLSWLNDLFESPEEYGTPSVTLTGQQVRSKGEKIIGNYLTGHGIAYYYEAQAMSNYWFIFKHKISKPDFFPSAIQPCHRVLGLGRFAGLANKGRLCKIHALEDGSVSQEQYQIHFDIPIQHAQP
jgi:hypothetical protein